MAALAVTAVPSLGDASALDPPVSQQLGTAQANRWMPLDAITLPTEAARRTFMLDRIRREVIARHSSLPLPELDRVLAVMNGIDREKFVDKPTQRSAYLPTSLDIGYGQTITDAYIAAVMTVAAQVPAGGQALDIGTGSGYQAAVLARLARHVTSIEIVPQLARQAGKRLRRLGYRNVDVRAGDGFLGAPKAAPFDTIIVAAGGRAVPQKLVDQLKIGGRMVVPVGPTALEEQLLVITKISPSEVATCSLGAANFVPMTGQAAALREAAATKKLPAIPLCYGQPVT